MDDTNPILLVAKNVADTLITRRDIEAEILAACVMGLPKDTPYWHGLSRQERNARIANDTALAAYRQLTAAAPVAE